MGGASFSYESALSTHSIAGTFGSAAAAACVAGHDAKRMRFVLDYAAQQAAGFIVWRRDKDHIEKAFVFAGRPASNGVTAALLVDSGWTGIDDVFSGADNFFSAVAPKAKPERVVDKLLGLASSSRSPAPTSRSGRSARPSRRRSTGSRRSAPGIRSKRTR